MGRDMMRLRRGILLNTPHEEQASGAVASFATDIGKLKECVVEFDPVQDLNGYDSPWPPGGSKNLIPDGTNTSNGYVNGKYLTNDGSLYADSAWYTSEYFHVTAGETYTWSTNGNPNSPSICFYDSGKNYLSSIQAAQELPKTFTVPSDAVYCRASQGKDFKTVGEQIELGSTATMPKPYSNICPISGWSEAKVTGTGKNLLNTAIKRLYSSTICEIGSSYTAFDLHLKAGTYTMSASFSGTTSYGGYCREKNGSGNIAFWYSNQTVGGIRKGTVTLPEGDYRFWLYYSGGISLDVIEWFQLELGSTASAYEPYSGDTYTIDLDGTRYGGTLNLLTGVFTGDRAIGDLGTMAWSSEVVAGSGNGNRFYSGSFSFVIKAPENLSVIPNIVCSMYKTKIASQYSQAIDGITIHTNKSVQIYDSTKKDLSAEEFKAAMSGVQLVYELAAPFTVQLTPAQLRAIKGQNNIFADCGDVAVKYWKH